MNFSWNIYTLSNYACISNVFENHIIIRFDFLIPKIFYRLFLSLFLKQVVEKNKINVFFQRENISHLRNIYSYSWIMVSLTTWSTQYYLTKKMALLSSRSIITCPRIFTWTILFSCVSRLATSSATFQWRNYEYRFTSKFKLKYILMNLFVANGVGNKDCTRFKKKKINHARVAYNFFFLTPDCRTSYHRK